MFAIVSIYKHIWFGVCCWRQQCRLCRCFIIFVVFVSPFLYFVFFFLIPMLNSCIRDGVWSYVVYTLYMQFKLQWNNNFLFYADIILIFIPLAHGFVLVVSKQIETEKKRQNKKLPEKRHKKWCNHNIAILHYLSNGLQCIRPYFSCLKL